MAEALDALTIALVWHEERELWHASFRQLYYSGLHDRRPVVVESGDVLLDSTPRLRGPLDFTVVHVDRLLHASHQPWQPMQPELFAAQDAF